MSEDNDTGDPAQPDDSRRHQSGPPEAGTDHAVPTDKAEPDDFAAPRVLGGRYEVGELIGRGGMAEVHLGHDLRLGRAVAIKILRNDLARDTSFLARFRREARSAAGLNHPAIVAVYDSGEQEVKESGGAPLQVPYIVMERVEGRTLREVLNDENVLDPDEAARVTASVLSGLDYAHEKGIVHRDIKPANVMVSRGGAVKVMDFGIARALADTAATMTQTQAVLGTARYLSPEQAQGNAVDARSDLYSAGCLLFELLCGRTPFQGDPVALVYQHISDPPKRPSTYQGDVPERFDAIALHALGKTPQTRYQSAAAFRDDLTAARAGRPISEDASNSLAQATGAASRPGSGAAAGMAARGFTGGAAGAVAGRREGSDAATEAIGVRPPVAARSAAGPTSGVSPAPPHAREDYEQTDEIPVREERHRGGYWLLAAFGLLALAAVAFVVFRILNPAEPEVTQVQVPSLINMDREDAQVALEEAKLDGEFSQKVDKAAVDEVIDQNPSANERVDEGETVEVIISSGPEAIKIPDVEGFTEEAARSRLETENIKVASDTEEANDVDFAAEEVVSTSPGANESISPDDEVTLTLASGLADIPNVVGQEQDDAIATLRELRLSPATTFEESDESAPGTVLEQSVDAGEEVEYGTRVTLTVARAAVPTVTQTETITATDSEPTTEPTQTTDTETTQTTDPEPTDTGATETTDPEPTDTEATETTDPEPTDTETTDPEPTETEATKTTEATETTEPDPPEEGEDNQ